jgi:hypothetical protein
MMMVRLGVVLFGISVFCSKLVHNTRFVMDDRFSILPLSSIIKFTLTGFTIQSLYYTFTSLYSHFISLILYILPLKLLL